jgi:hypothetical protein
MQTKTLLWQFHAVNAFTILLTPEVAVNKDLRLDLFKILFMFLKYVSKPMFKFVFIFDFTWMLSALFQSWMFPLTISTLLLHDCDFYRLREANSHSLNTSILFALYSIAQNKFNWSVLAFEAALSTTLEKTNYILLVYFLGWNVYPWRLSSERNNSRKNCFRDIHVCFLS